MRPTLNHLTDDEKLKVVEEYLYTNITQTALMEKYNFRGNCSLNRWIAKFGLLDEYRKIQGKSSTMTKEKSDSPEIKELEARIRVLERDLEHERLRSLALDTMIDVAENELKIKIRKKSGAKQ